MEKETPLSISFPVLQLQQPIGEFYIARIPHRDLIRICDFDVRRILQEREVETYLGIQRPLVPKRVAELHQYVNSIDAAFPTGIIIAVPEACVSLNESGDNMTLSNVMDTEDEADRVYFRSIARVLDGQHRLAGLEKFSGETFELSATIFVGLDISDQAMIFATVNLAQTKVNPSLVYDLYALARHRSPERTCHEIVVALDRNQQSPFFKRIKRLGVATEGKTQATLSQATVVDRVLAHISTNPALDRDWLRRGKNLPSPSPLEHEKLIFRSLFLKEEDFQIADIVWNYFEAVRQRWPRAWASTGRGNILPRTNGYRALMRLLRFAYRNETAGDEVIETAAFFRIFEKVRRDDDYFTVANFDPGTSGETKLFKLLFEETGLERAFAQDKG